MRTLPNDVIEYKSTALFDEDSVPAALKKEHRTKAGTWGHILLESGSLRYRILEPNVEEHLLDPEHAGVVEPRVRHEVELIGPVRFRVAFMKVGYPRVVLPD